jgi:hypothetical protein
LSHQVGGIGGGEARPIDGFVGGGFHGCLGWD